MPRDELTKSGILGQGGQVLKLADLETPPDTRYLHCSGTESWPFEVGDNRKIAVKIVMTAVLSR